MALYINWKVIDQIELPFRDEKGRVARGLSLEEEKVWDERERENHGQS